MLDNLFKNGINPKWMIALVGLIDIQKGIGAGAMSLTNMIPDSWIPHVTAWNTGLAWIGIQMVGVLAALSSNSAGPLVRLPSLPSIDTTKAVAKVLIAVFVLSFLVAGGSQAHAQSHQKKTTVTTDAGNKKCLIPWDPLKLCGALTGNPEEDMQRVVKRIQGVGRLDMNYAILKAKAANTNGSKVRLQCLQAILDAKNAAEGTDIKDDKGNVIPRPDPAAVTTIEDVAELVDGLSPQGPLMTGCAGAAQMLKTNTLAVINAIVTGAAGIAAMPVVPGL